MKPYLENAAYRIPEDSRSIAPQIVLLMVTLAICFAFVLAFKGIGREFWEHTYRFEPDASNAHGKLSHVLSHNDVVQVTCEGACLQCAASYNVADRHLCMAEAFNAAIAHKRQQIALQSNSSVVVR